MKTLKKYCGFLMIVGLGSFCGCSEKAGLDAGQAVKSYDTRTRTVTAQLSDVGLVNYETIPVFGTKTSIQYHNLPETGVTTHPVIWMPGDRIYSYAASGVYMVYSLVSDDIKLLSGGRQTKYELLYRVGDPWVTSYVKGPRVGEYTGYRTKEGLTLLDGVRREQRGVFSDFHIALAQENPDAELFTFHDMQAFVRFEITGKLWDGKILEYPVNKITITSLNNDNMAGNQEIKNVDGSWRCSTTDSGNAEDKMITVIPDGGTFLPSVKNPSGDTTYTNYFVAVPARRYGKGIRFNLFTAVSGGYEQKAYVETPSFTLTGNQIVDCSDLLAYIVIFVEELKLEYPAGTDPEVEENIIPAEGIEIVEGHTAKIGTYIYPYSATNQVLTWEVTEGSAYVSVSQNGEVTGLAASGTNKATIKVKTIDGSEVYAEFKVKVTPDVVASGGDYTHGGYEW